MFQLSFGEELCVEVVTVIIMFVGMISVVAVGSSICSSGGTVVVVVFIVVVMVMVVMFISVRGTQLEQFILELLVAELRPVSVVVVADVAAAVQAMNERQDDRR